MEKIKSAIRRTLCGFALASSFLAKATHFSRLISYASFSVLLCPHILDAADLLVDARDAGTRFHTIQAALDQAKAGDTIHVKPGIYRERVVFKSGGEQGSPVTLEGEPGAILDGSEDMPLDWKPAPEIGPGVYRVPVPFFAYTISVNGQLITTLSETKTSPNPAEPHPIHNGWKNLNWVEVFKGEGVGPSGWDGVRGLAMYRRNEKDLIIRFKDQLDPRTLKITVAPKESACITIKGHNRCVVRGLEIRYSPFGVKIADSVGSVIEQCMIGSVDYGITLEPGSDRCTIRCNDISYQPYAEADYTAPGEWDAWQACKTGGFTDRWAVRIDRSLGGHRIHDNYIHDEWDGIETLDIVYWPPKHVGTAKTNANTEVDHNYFYRVFDDGIETAGPVANVSFHDNIFRLIRCAFRIKAPTLGPFFVYRNFFLENGEDFRNWGEVSFAVPFDPASISAEAWIYQNTSTSLSAVTMNYSPEPLSAISAPNYHYFNNLFWCKRWVSKLKNFPDPDWKADYNVFVRTSEHVPYPWAPLPYKGDPEKLLKEWNDGIALAKKCRIEEHSHWVADQPPGFVDAAGGNFALTSSSVARGCGLDLSTLKTADGASLPGVANSNPKPDVGAIQFGETMPHFPRKPSEIKEPAAGIWP